MTEKEKIDTSVGQYELCNKGPKLKFRDVGAIEVEDREFLVPYAIPRGKITAIVGAGESGKSNVIAQIVASVTLGDPMLITKDGENPDYKGSKRVLYFSGEEDFKQDIKPRFLSYGADCDNIKGFDSGDAEIMQIYYTNPDLMEAVLHFKPDLIIFDPIQSFVPPRYNMTSRKHMRTCMTALNQIAVKANCAVIVVVHTNKRVYASDRTRMADSADLWDMIRSIFLVGKTGKTINGNPVFYISHEKSNFKVHLNTILFTIENGVVVFRGYSEKKDIEFVYHNNRFIKTPVSRSAEECILRLVSDGAQHKVHEINEKAREDGYSDNAIRNAKNKLKTDKKIKYISTGVGSEKKHYIQINKEDK